MNILAFALENLATGLVLGGLLGALRVALWS